MLLAPMLASLMVVVQLHGGPASALKSTGPDQSSDFETREESSPTEPEESQESGPLDFRPRRSPQLPQFAERQRLATGPEIRAADLKRSAPGEGTRFQASQTVLVRYRRLLI
jgi:hypothetical protein